MYYRAEILINVVHELDQGLTLGRFFQVYGVDTKSTADIMYRYEKVGNPLFDDSQDYRFVFGAKECARTALFSLVDDILSYWTCCKLISITEKEES